MADFPRFTKAQLKALEWLPGDGSWATQPGRTERAIHSLILYFPTLAECEFGNFGLRGGSMMRYRLTPRGAEIKAALEKKNG